MYLPMIINSSLATGIVTSAIRQARVCPIFKHGLKTYLNNYRPISILPYLSKLFEKVIYTRLYDYINKLEILYPDQHGFQPNHSNTMSLLNTYDEISLVFDNNEYALGVFLELSKEFYTVNHKILFKKLELYGIRGIPLLWFENYLLSRQQHVRCNGKLSDFLTIEHGVSQGSILGPLLFLLYINDLPNASSILHFVLFADESNDFASNGSYDKLFQIINTELPHDWFKANRLSLNTNKTTFIYSYCFAPTG